MTLNTTTFDKQLHLPTHSDEESGEGDEPYVHSNQSSPISETTTTTTTTTTNINSPLRIQINTKKSIYYQLLTPQIEDLNACVF